jgi:hypothetical protein
MCNQLRSILNWAVKYNADVSPTYGDVCFPKVSNQKIALSPDEVSRIAHFDIDLFYAKRRKDFRETMRRIRDMFVLSCNLFQRHSDMVRIDPTCFERNIFSITQQKTGQRAIVNIDQFAIDAKTTYKILEEYGYRAPYTGSIGNYNYHLRLLMKDIGFNETIRIEFLDHLRFVDMGTAGGKKIETIQRQRKAKHNKRYVAIWDSRGGDQHRPSIMREARHIEARMTNYLQDFYGREVQAVVYKTFAGMKAIDLNV